MLAVTLLASTSRADVQSLGVCFGTAQMVRNLPGSSNPLSNRDAVAILNTKCPGVRKVKLFDMDLDCISALTEGNIHEITACCGWNDKIKDMDQAYADHVVSQVRTHVESGTSMTLAIGNEPFHPQNQAAYGVTGDQLVTAVQNIRDAINRAGLQGKLHFTVPFQMTPFQGYPPRSGYCDPKFARAIRQVTQMIMDDGGKFSINMYPFLAAVGDPEHIKLAYALGQEGFTPNTDGDTTHYPSLMHSMMATVRAALTRLDATFTDDKLPISIGEVGWPTAGHDIATTQNAEIFADCVLRSGFTGHLFEAFDEGNKSAAGVEKGGAPEDHYGVLKEDGSLKYQIGGGIAPLNE